MLATCWLRQPRVYLLPCYLASSAILQALCLAIFLLTLNFNTRSQSSRASSLASVFCCDVPLLFSSKIFEIPAPSRVNITTLFNFFDSFLNANLYLLYFLFLFFIYMMTVLLFAKKFQTKCSSQHHPIFTFYEGAVTLYAGTPRYPLYSTFNLGYLSVLYKCTGRDTFPPIGQGFPTLSATVLNQPRRLKPL